MDSPASGFSNMLLAARYQHAFSAKVVAKGLDYFEESSVDTLRLAGPRAEAEVWGSGRKSYLVRILAARKPVRLLVECTCPHADRGYFCKHIYASLLEIGNPALRFPVPGAGRINLDFLSADEAWDMSSASEHRPCEADDIWCGEDQDDDELNHWEWQDDLDDDEDAEFEIDVASPSAQRGYETVSRRRIAATRPSPAADDWSARLEEIAARANSSPRPLVSPANQDPAAATRELVFRIDLSRCLVTGNLTLEFLLRQYAVDGSLSDLEPISLHPRDPALAELDVDQNLLGKLLALPEIEPEGAQPWAAPGAKVPDSKSHVVIPEAYYAVLLPELAATGRLLAEPPGPVPDTSRDQARTNREPIPVAWDTGPAWRFGLEIERDQTREATQAETALVQLRGTLERGEVSRSLSDAWLVLQRGVVLFEGTLAAFDRPEIFSWVADLRRRGQFELPLKDVDTLISQLAAMPDLPEIRGLESIGWQRVSGTPRPVLHVEVPAVRESRAGHRAPSAAVSLRFEYALPRAAEHSSEDVDERALDHAHARPPNEQSAVHDPPAQKLVVLCSEPREILADHANRHWLQRDREAEAGLGAELIDLGARARRMSTEARFEMPRYLRDGAIAEAEIPLSRFSEIIHALLERGFRVEADGARWRRAHSSSIRVSSGIDWFELQGSVDFGDAGSAELPELLAALERGERTVRLGDGSHGLLPEEWLRQVAPLKQLGELEGDLLRFAPNQATLLDALLTAREQDGDAIEVDAHFAKLRKRLRGRQQIKPRNAPRGFRGELREYQREGLAWLHFLSGLGLGGCLADDMGLGKTIQVLSLLEARRVRRLQKGEDRLPSLVVAPTSVVHNWLQEAARFTPKLSVLDFTGKDRAGLLNEFAGAHLILTSYGTLRRDIAKLADQRFDYAILDEAQAIKNDKSQTAKSARLLRASHRLVLTGTPVENHLGELFSLFEFLNPGLQGRNPALRKLVGSQDPKDAETLVTLTEALRPLILRRNKEDVLTELPSKTEQTLYCDLPPAQRRQYDELRKRYRDSLLGRIADKGLPQSKIQVLEALLRLRQAACHPGLIDEAKLEQGSAKLDVLLEQLEEVVAEGHKVLVYSQFTKLLKIVRQRLDAKKMTYEYLDGRTRKRQDRVERFQTDPACPVFLISLKAGGVGLNLTAADYVFILDPWWNPAAEAQAIDRAHRMGQERPVFAYRIIARDTVEERILELQERKRGIADAIVAAEGGVLRELSLDDLRGLLG